jgi:hypothetical protein
MRCQDELVLKITASSGTATPAELGAGVSLGARPKSRPEAPAGRTSCGTKHAPTAKAQRAAGGMAGQCVRRPGKTHLYLKRFNAHYEIPAASKSSAPAAPVDLQHQQHQ